MHGRNEYYEQLEKRTKDRYGEKLNFNGPGPEVDDPYVLPIPASPCIELLPDVEYPIFTIICTLSPVTKAYKSLEGYKYI